MIRLAMTSKALDVRVDEVDQLQHSFTWLSI